jgi:hypothetical protein
MKVDIRICRPKAGSIFMLGNVIDPAECPERQVWLAHERFPDVLNTMIWIMDSQINVM